MIFFNLNASIIYFNLKIYISYLDFLKHMTFLDDYDIFVLLIVKSYEFNPARAHSTCYVSSRSGYYYL